ncbi:BTAD domain-containing putative transcriptional regulator [Rhodococcus sp. IEGM 1379]|uniref:BTAD domain-containing putative transcriptional regulator n=1 Tax=Rhodococcus sp. IEGM 1379 TaxID=3047086 RepID=UPI0024B7A9AC|nr:BTAD domain-containing putative transcriptional regulator [Rhodococcus sp. IEGM 1379]MDI9917243.1 BTAD domain-containing putative transcriptional regulator [Rhodococcus sp. IEGM 1379]
MDQDKARDAVDIGLLGAVSTSTGDRLVALPGPRARALLTVLALVPGRPCPAQNLIEEIWGSDPPRSPMNALHTQVSRLRSALPEGSVEVTAAGYRLTVPRDRVDLARAQDALRGVRADADSRESLRVVTAALSLWRGSAGDDVVGVPGEQLASTASRLHDELSAVRLHVLLALGDFSDALPVAQIRHSGNPFDDTAAGDLMRALAGLGRTNEALEVFAAFKAHLADRLGGDPSPGLVELNAALLSTPLPRAASAPARSTRAIGLRAAPNSLLGRASDIENVEELLSRSRVVTVLGPGGAGKTRLAHELGLRASARTSVALVELAALRSSEDVIAAIGATLGISESDLAPGRLTVGRTHSARERLAEALSAGPMTLILDNCEHVIGACSDIVAELIAAGGQLTVLATSRSPLMISAEVVYPLPPLAIEGNAGSAVELFSARARAVRPSVRLDAETVGKLCTTLDGLPLAIELAAARARTMSVEEISSRLSDRFALLRSGDPTSPDRHRTLHAVIDWSWNLLGAEHRVALARLCRFPAGFTLASAEAVAEWGQLADVADAVEALVNQSLLSVVDTSNGLRYHMLETVREYGEEQLAALGEGAEVLRRLNQWAVDIAADARKRSRSDQVRLAAEIDEEHDNLLAVLRWAVERGDGRVVANVFPVLGLLWAIRGSHSEVANWAPKVVEATNNHDLADVNAELAAMTFMMVAMHLLFGAYTRDHARARLRLRKILRERDDLAPTFVFLIRLMVGPQSGYRVARLVAEGMRSPDVETRMAALATRANMRENLGDLRGALGDSEELLRYACGIGDEWGVAMAAQQVGSVHSQSARYIEAVAFYAMAAASTERLGAHEEALQLISFQAGALIAGGDTVGGRALLDQIRPALAVSGGSAAMENAPRRAALFASVAEADLAEGHIELGLGHYREALELLGGEVENVYGDPFVVLLSAAAVCAHAVHGEFASMVDRVRRMSESSVIKLHPNGYADLPLAGSVAAAVGAYDLCTGNLSRGTELMALSVKMPGRQDFFSLHHGRLEAFAAGIVGEDRWRVEMQKVSGLSRRAVREAVLAALRGPLEN